MTTNELKNDIDKLIDKEIDNKSWFGRKKIREKKS